MIKLNYITQNREYQRLLDSKYHGQIVPIERLINYDRANILHHCLGCGDSFYELPNTLLYDENQGHLCSMSLKQKEGKKRIPIRAWRVITDEIKEDIYKMTDQGLSTSEVAKKLEVSVSSVRKYLRKRVTSTCK
jgi:ribosome-binding protein aMBF1 (putative translation factor)